MIEKGLNLKESWCRLMPWYLFSSDPCEGLNLLLFHYVFLSLISCSRRPTPTAKRSGWLPWSWSPKTMNMKEQEGCWRKPVAVPPPRGWDVQRVERPRPLLAWGRKDGRGSSFAFAASEIYQMASCHCLSQACGWLLKCFFSSVWHEANVLWEKT